MIRSIFTAAALAALLLAGCSGERGLSCESGERYRHSDTIGAIRVPDDLSVPDESEALRVPPPPEGESRTAGEGCLEAPPDFYEDGVGEEDVG